MYIVPIMHECTLVYIQDWLYVYIAAVVVKVYTLV